MPDRILRRSNNNWLKSKKKSKRSKKTELVVALLAAKVCSILYLTSVSLVFETWKRVNHVIHTCASSRSRLNTSLGLRHFINGSLWQNALSRYFRPYLARVVFFLELLVLSTSLLLVWERRVQSVNSKVSRSFVRKS